MQWHTTRRFSRHKPLVRSRILIPKNGPETMSAGQELNLHCTRRVGYSHFGTPMPSRRISLGDHTVIPKFLEVIS